MSYSDHWFRVFKRSMMYGSITANLVDTGTGIRSSEGDLTVNYPLYILKPAETGYKGS